MNLIPALCSSLSKAYVLRSRVERKVGYIFFVNGPEAVVKVLQPWKEMS